MEECGFPDAKTAMYYPEYFLQAVQYETKFSTVTKLAWTGNEHLNNFTRVFMEWGHQKDVLVFSSLVITCWLPRRLIANVKLIYHRDLCYLISQQWCYLLTLIFRITESQTQNYDGANAKAMIQRSFSQITDYYTELNTKTRNLNQALVTKYTSQPQQPEVILEAIKKKNSKIDGKED